MLLCPAVMAPDNLADWWSCSGATHEIAFAWRTAELCRNASPLSDIVRRRTLPFMRLNILSSVTSRAYTAAIFDYGMGDRAMLVKNRLDKRTLIG